MNELISVTKNENGDLLVSARELHEFLEVNSNFTTWMKRMISYGFEENIDYTTFWSDSKNGSAVEYLGSSQKMSASGYESNYALKLDMAKEIAMIQRSEKGKQARLYFIECEKQLRKQTAQLSAEDKAIVEIIHQVKAGNVPQAVGTVLEYGQEKYDEGYDKGQNDKEEELQPVIEFAEVFEKADGKLRVREAAKLVYDKDRINVGERKLHALLRYWGWELYNGSSTTEPSQNAIKAGWLIAKPITRYNKDSNRYHVTYTPYVTPKGLALITKKLLKMSTSDINQIYKEDKIKMKKFKVNLK